MPFENNLGKQKLFGYRNKAMGFDLGSANSLIYLHKKGMVLREPSVIAFNTHDGAILAVGREAKAMIGKNPESITVVKPLQNGAIADFDATRMMLKHFLRSTLKRLSISRPHMVISIPYGATDIEQKAVLEVCKQSGIKSVLMIEEPLAAAMGAGLKIDEPSGNMVVNIGAGTAEVAVISLGGIVNACSVKVAGDAMDQAIYNYLKRKYQLEVGMLSAERIKIKYANANEQSVVLRGIDLKTGLPVARDVPVGEINQVIIGNLKDLLKAIRKVFESIPPQLASDIISKGLLLTGGGANLKNIDRIIFKTIRLPVTVSQNPEECVALGAGMLAGGNVSLANISLLGAHSLT